ncbi:MAG: YifB family Mg chelatase-like AAA ATPase [Microthrixaceae bacterium]
MLGLVPSACLLGVDGHAVTVEVHITDGLPSFTVVGLPDASCREARDRVRAALLSSGCKWPMRRVTVNLAPPTVRKVGSGLDLPIAVAMLVASEQVTQEAVGRRAFLGELGLEGTVRGVNGTICLTEALDADALVLPTPSVEEARLVSGRALHPVRSLREVVACLRGEDPWPVPGPALPIPPRPPLPDLADVRGQPVARFALEVAAAGAHHLLMLGPPGAGKTMLAARLPGLLPALDDRQAMETTRVHSAAGLLVPRGGLVRHPPFRAPHHGASSVALVGGGTVTLRPGEISAATNGVLFLDELAEFAPHVLDALRQPLEEGVVRVARAVATVAFPARFLLVAAMNPCPCGYGSRPGGCRCTEGARLRYQRRLSGPLLDRFDLRVEVSRPSVEDLLGHDRGEASADVAARVAAARALARSRGVQANSTLPVNRLDEVAPLSAEATTLLEDALRSGRLSARGLHRVRRVARTIADLQGAPGAIEAAHVAIALGLRVDSPRGHPSARGDRAVSEPDPVALGAAIVLAGLPGMGPRRLAALLDEWDPVQARARATSGRAAQLVGAAGTPVLREPTNGTLSSLLSAWHAAATDDGAESLAAHERAGVAVLLRDDPQYPAVLRDDIEPPAVLFATGELRALDRPRVAVVGTRRCTGSGAGVARDLGRDLAAEGVAGVSGLALGLDGAAHRGVLDARQGREDAAPPVGVVGSGLDVVYPPRHRELWAAVAAEGVLFSEAPLGARPGGWRFPARNRVIAALADVVVVVESHAAGGSLHTVTEAERRDTPVLAVPGSVRSPAASGTNQLLAEGCHPARDAQDVLVALGLTPAARRASQQPSRPLPAPDGERVLEAFSWEPATLEHLAVRTGLALGELGLTLERLVTAGWVQVQGGWYERVAG